MTETITKKKKKIDFELLRKLEDEYDEAVEDTERKERILLESVYEGYKKAENKTEFFKQLHYGENWYRGRWKQDEDKFPLLFASKSEAVKQVRQEQKVSDIVSDLEDMADTPILEVDESLKEGTDYVDPTEQRKDWIEKTKEELLSETPKKITEDSNFGKYQQTKQMLSKARDVSKYDFNVGEKYRPILIHQLKKTINYLNKLLEEIK